MIVEFKASFLRSLKKIRTKKLLSSVHDVIIHCETVSRVEDIHHIKKLKGFQSYYRIRLGDYRIGLKLEDEILYFVEIDHRKDIYKKFP